jgi:c-di-AMP phosphodiesterase-like protein
MDIKIIQHKTRLDSLFVQVSKVTEINAQGEWAKYLCVLSSGYLENSLRILFTNYISVHSNLTVQRFIEPNISSLTNCKNGKIVKYLEQFNPNWSMDYLHKIEAESIIPNQIKDSVDSLVQNRHDIAHGKNVGIGYVRVKEYFDLAHKVITIIDGILT